MLSLSAIKGQNGGIKDRGDVVNVQTITSYCQPNLLKLCGTVYSNCKISE